MELTPVTTKFVLHWGEMGSRWGVNRTVAQIHALLFIADAPLTAEAIADTLGIARSNVSTSLKELQNWGLARIVHQLGDRRDHFDTPKDVWEMFRIVLEERRKRELDPTLSVLRDALLDEHAHTDSDAQALARIRSVLDFLETLTGWADEMKDLPPATAMRLMRLGVKVQRALARV
jgi:DNA-binding transcriptional regulator GbsR (MarR family)